MEQFTPANRALVVEDVVRQIQSRILDGQLQMGDRLPPEVSLADQMGVGRNAMREALRTLEAQGWLSRSRQGTRVLASPLELLVQPIANVALLQGLPVRQLFEVRRALEGELAALASERATSIQVEAITRDAAGLAEPNLENETFIKVNLDFHMAIADAAHNPLLGVLLESVRHLLVEAQRLGAPVKEMRESAIAAHAAIAGAIAQRDPIAARAAMHRHLREIEDGLRQHLPGYDHLKLPR